MFIVFLILVSLSSIILSPHWFENEVVAEFFENELTGTIPKSLCALRTPPTGTGVLAGLTADCGVLSSGEVEIVCECCTSCSAQE